MVWKICLFLFLAISYSHGIPLELTKESIKMLQKEFNTSKPDVAEGGAIFRTYLKKDRWPQAEERKILLAQIISKYLDLLTNLNSTQYPEDIRNLVEVLHNYKQNNSKSFNKAKDLTEIAKLPMDNVKIQRKAITEFYDVILEVNRDVVQRKRRSRKQKPSIPMRYKPNPRA